MQKTIPLDDYILDTLLRDLTGHDRKPAAFLVYLWLTGEQSRRRSAVGISYIELAQNTGLSRSSAQASVRWLLRRKLLSVTKANPTAVPVYTVQFPWRRHPGPVATATPRKCCKHSDRRYRIRA